jgi:hypothetical protein
MWNKNSFVKAAFLCALVALITGCSYKTRVPDGIGIPYRVSHIEFWNGGTCIGAYDSASVSTKIDTAEKLFGDSISFYRYEITVEGATDVIVDSEALAITNLYKSINS